MIGNGKDGKWTCKVYKYCWMSANGYFTLDLVGFYKRYIMQSLMHLQRDFDYFFTIGNLH